MYSEDFEKGYIYGYILSTKDSVSENITEKQIDNILKQVFTSFNIISNQKDYNNAKKIHDKCEEYGKNLIGGA
jgi:hypothetical protein